ncbi:MAG: hypothetical protein Q8868_14240 [Bacteroidota bacterium]|nr:hypothetical protein [Bacteroidota bacterium]
MFSKLKFFFLLIFCALLSDSCSRNNKDIIPDVTVDFTIDLLDPEFANLSVIGVADTVDASTNNWGYRSAGFDGNGIIIYSGPGEYDAYDRTCPYDYASGGVSVKLRLDASVAVCPKCNTKYSLATYGAPVSGPGKYQLKNYRTSFDGDRFIRVWNQ